MGKLSLLGLSLASGILLFAAWPVSPFTFLIFFAWIPLLKLADAQLKINQFLLYTFLTMLIWNSCTTWWIWNSTDVGSIAAIVANSILMCIPWWGYFFCKKRVGTINGYVFLVVFWMLFEYVHLNWQLSWPWLSLGNVFASKPKWIQWYEFTGVAGGTLWVLVSNILGKILLENGALWQLPHLHWKSIAIWAVCLLLPLAVSQILLLQHNPPSISTATKAKVLIVQPNIDPYQKYDPLTTANQIEHLIRLSEQQIDSSTKLVVWPETALSVQDWQDHIVENLSYKPVFDFVQRHPTATLLSGIDSYKRYGTTKATSTARMASNGIYYDAFNAAIAIKAGLPLDFYNKSKLVPGVETMPSFLNFLAPLFEKFGGSTGGYGTDDTSKVFSQIGNPLVAAPVICYESIYGEYVSTYVKRGANIITIITNDGWWGNTQGHQQHLFYARLRAIETRRWVARSANTGISAVIDNEGNIVASQPWAVAATIEYKIPICNQITFYVQWGDYLYKIASILAICMIGWSILNWKKVEQHKGLNF